jgi:cystinosin
MNVRNNILLYHIFYLTYICDIDKQRNNSNENLVRANDVMFSVHAFLISSFTLIQTFYYKKDHSQHVSKIAQYFISFGILGAFVVMATIYTKHAMLIDLMYYLSYVKMAVSLIKYIPQVYLSLSSVYIYIYINLFIFKVWINFHRKSTVGWSIHNILLDCTGGMLSITQLLLDASLSGDWSGVSGDPVKLYVVLFIHIYLIRIILTLFCN